MIELLLLCTKHVHFRIDRDIYIQLDDVAMGSPLGPLLANVFMYSFEELIVPTIKDCLVIGKDTLMTHTHIVLDKIDYVMKKLNTYELEKVQHISFLDVSIRRLTLGKHEPTVFRKETNTDVYINWNSHVPMQWEIGTLKNLVKISILICSDQHVLLKQVDYLRKVFVKINDYPSKTVEHIIVDLQKENANITNKQQTNTTNNNKIKLQLFLPLQGKHSVQLLSNNNSYINN